MKSALSILASFAKLDLFLSNLFLCFKFQNMYSVTIITEFQMYSLFIEYT